MIIFCHFSAAIKKANKKKRIRESADGSNTSGSTGTDQDQSNPGPSNPNKRARKTSQTSQSSHTSQDSSEFDSKSDILTIEAPSPAILKDLSKSSSVSPSSASALTSSKKKSAAAARNRSTSQDVSEQIENQLPAKLSEDLKAILEHDFYRVTRRKMLPTLPKRPNVATLLEDYVRYYYSKNRFSTSC
jgi:hypothetical protein